ncbi:ATP-dependent DNA helicase DinG [Terribacillus halophilus]|uniref:ATP-dependent DNA helicase DinG n=1 Tax=Terribacillus halophilus TaxID=361279 RepID=UPI0009863FF1|nr:ATP-dependent DNA helicase DinG [Terribacillus halophilus]
MEKFVVVDLETTGHAPSNGDKIIEVGIVVIQGRVVTDQFQTMLDPGMPIPPFISQLTGISDEDVTGAPRFEEVAEEIAAFFQDSYVVAHNANFDLRFLNSSLEASGLAPISCPVLDTVELARIMLPTAPSYKLSVLSEYLSFEHDQPHRALSDTLVTAELLLSLLEKMDKLPYETIAHLLTLERALKSDLRALLDARLEDLAFEAEQDSGLEVYRGLAIRRLPENERTNSVIAQSFGELADQVYRKDGLLSEGMRSYEPRGSQQEMSEQIYDVFHSSRHALLEAETGTGKSLAYLLPAVFTAVKEKSRVVISTHLTQLQAQLMEKEIPLLQRLLPFSFKAALLKGKQHYLSLSRFESELQQKANDNYDITLTKAILLVWLTITETGDIDEVNLPSSGKRFFLHMSADSEDTQDPFSPWFSRSFYQRAKKAAWQADIIVTNHALLCSDMQEEYQLLPSYERAIIDEAHHFEATAAKHFGLALDYVSIHHMLSHANKVYDKATEQLPHPQAEMLIWQSLWEQTKIEADDMFRYIHEFVLSQHRNKLGTNDIGRMQLRLEEVRNTKALQVIAEMGGRLLFGIRDCIHHLLQLVKTAEKQADKKMADSLQNAVNQLQSIIDSIERMFLVTDDEEVKWIEVDVYGARNSVYLYSEPLAIADMLFERFFSEKKSIVLTSATLTMKQSFEFIQLQLGLDEQTVTKRFDSPYSYQEQVQLLVPNDFPDVRGKDNYPFIYAVCEAILSLAAVTDGRMLVLFTSYDMLKKAHGLVKELTDDQDYMLIAQGITSGSRDRLKKNFQSNKKSILFGTSSFWEGVDIPGEDLSCLVIVRLPFQPPDHPIYEAKAAKLKAEGKNAFMELALPNAVIRFKQGFGRLIRSSSDRGIVFVCDDRMIKARYGNYFTASIPEVPTHYQSTAELLELAEHWL